MNNPPSTNATSTTGNAAGAGEQTGATGNQSPSMGVKFKAAIQVIHGVGENIRGTALGAIDALSKNGDTRNQDIATKGRLDTEQGLATLRSSRSQPAAPSAGIGGHPGVEPQQGQPTTAGSGAAGGEHGQQYQPYSQAEKSAAMGQSPISTSQRNGSGPGAPPQYSRKFGAENEAGPVSQDRGNSGQVADGGGSRAYHHRDDAVTDFKGEPGEQHGAGQLSSADKEKMPAYEGGHQS